MDDPNMPGQGDQGQADQPQQDPMGGGQTWQDPNAPAAPAAGGEEPAPAAGGEEPAADPMGGGDDANQGGQA